MSSVSLAGLNLKGRIKFPPLLKNLSITFTESLITKGLNFLNILILTRTLGPEAYGKYSFVFVAVATCSALFDFGMENTAVRFAARDKDKKQAIFGLYLAVKLSLLLLLVLFFIFFGEWFFSLMHKDAIKEYIPFLIMGLIGESLFFVNDTYLQANQHFKLRALINISRFTVALLIIAGLFAGNMVALQSVFYLYAVPLLFSALFLEKYYSFLKAYLAKALEAPLLREIFHYEKWMFVYSVAYNLLGRLDFFMLGFWVGFQQLGIYNAAYQLSSIVSFLPMALGKVLLPALSELDHDEIFHKTRKMVRVINLICLVAALTVPLTYWIVPLLLGKEYVEAISILQILLIAFIITLLSMPYEQSLYSLGQPKVLSIGRYSQLIMIIALNLLILPFAGSLYGAYVVALTGLFGRLVYYFYSRHFYLSYESKAIERQRKGVAPVTGAA